MPLPRPEHTTEAHIQRYTDAMCPYTPYNAVTQLVVEGLDGEGDFTLTQQIDELGVFSEHPIDIIALTLKSAAACGDIIRGVFAAANQQCPQIIGVNASRETALPAIMSGGSYGAYRASSRLDELFAETPENIYISEANRLRPHVSSKNVCVIDEWVFTGGTIAYAKFLLEQANASAVSVISGRWYENYWNHDDVMCVRGLSAGRYSDLLTEAGAISYRVANAEKRIATG